MCAKWRLMDFHERYVWHMEFKGALGALENMCAKMASNDAISMSDSLECGHMK